MAVLSSNGFVDSSEGCQGPVGLVLDTTNFYAEQGGQVADIGCLASSSCSKFDVQDTQVMSCPFWLLLRHAARLLFHLLLSRLLVKDKSRREQQHAERFLITTGAVFQKPLSVE